MKKATLALNALRLVNRIFYSLNYQDLPEFFEDNMAGWMAAFLSLLSSPTLPPAAAAREADDEEAGPGVKMQAAVIENISLYASKYGEEFSPYLGNFTSAVWGRLVTLTRAQSDDALAIASMQVCIFAAICIPRSLRRSFLLGNPVSVEPIPLSTESRVSVATYAPLLAIECLTTHASFYLSDNRVVSDSRCVASSQRQALQRCYAPTDL